MSAGIWFWLIYVLSVVFGLGWGYRLTPDQRPAWYGGGLVLWILLFLVGWRLFGSPVN